MENKKSAKSKKKGGDNENKLTIRDSNYETVEAKHLEVKVFNNNFDRAYKAFRTLVQSERVLSVYKEKQSYDKPSVKKRKKSAEARKRALEFEAKQRKIASGEYEKEKLKKQLLKEKKRAEKNKTTEIA